MTPRPRFQLGSEAGRTGRGARSPAAADSTGAANARPTASSRSPASSAPSSGTAESPEEMASQGSVGEGDGRPYGEGAAEVVELVDELAAQGRDEGRVLQGA